MIYSIFHVFNPGLVMLYLFYLLSYISTKLIKPYVVSTPRGDGPFNLAYLILINHLISNCLSHIRASPYTMSSLIIKFTLVSI